jgi:spermidine synthase
MDQGPARTRLHHAVYLAFFVSGAAGLVLQVVWVRLLKLVFGSTVLATSTVLSAFMAGLALGSFAFGRLADRHPNRIRLYALLELGTGASALLLPSLFQAAAPAWAALYRWQLASPWPGLVPLVLFALCFAVLLAPTSLMGGTLPVLAAHLVDSRAATGRRVGLLYGLNTLGATLGCFGAGFVLIPYLGQTLTLRTAAACYLAIGAMFLAYSRRAPLPVAAPWRDQAAPETDRDGMPARLARWVLVAFGLSGAVSLGYEVAWTRMLVFFVGLDTYAFSTMLTVLLLGLGLGSYLYTRLWDPQSGLVGRLALVEAGIGGVAAASLLVLPGMGRLNEMALGWELVRTTWPGLVLLNFADALVVILVPSLLMGATFPLATRALASMRQRGRSIGAIYSANTVGAIAGSFVTGFLLIPRVGAQGAVILLAGANLLIGLSLGLAAGGRPRRVAIGSAVAVAAAWGGVAYLAVRTPTIAWTPGFQDPEFGYRLLYAKEGAAASVAVLERQDGIRELNLDGKSTAFTNYSDIQVHQYLGHLPLLLCPASRPPRVLVVGFGLGSTAWACLQHPVEAVDCVELVPEERETAAYFTAYNHGVLEDPRFHWITGDGRNYLTATDRRYEVVSINAIHPRFSPSLYTSDFYQRVRARLADDGVVCAWITLHGLTLQDYRMLLGSLLAVFPEASLWDVNSQHMVLIASPRPLSIDYARWQERLQASPVQAHLAEVHLDQPYAILSHLLLDAQGLRAFCADAPPNSDDRPRVEFGHGISATSKAEIFNELLRRRTSVLPLLTHLPAAPEARAALHDDLARCFVAMQSILPARFFLSVTHDRARAHPLLERAQVLWPENRAIAYLLGQGELVAADERAAGFQRHWARGWVHESAGEWAAAVAEYRRAMEANPGFAEAYRSLALALARQGRLAEASQVLGRLVQLDPRPAYARWQVALRLQLGLAESDQDSVAVSYAGGSTGFRRHDPQTELYLASAYAEVGLPDLAAEILRRAAQRYPPSADLHEAMGRLAEQQGRFRKAEVHFDQALVLDPLRRRVIDQLQQLRKSVGPLIRPKGLEPAPEQP